jgi:hypothetical protein
MTSYHLSYCVTAEKPAPPPSQIFIYGLIWRGIFFVLLKFCFLFNFLQEFFHVLDSVETISSLSA